MQQEPTFFTGGHSAAAVSGASSPALIQWTDDEVLRHRAPAPAVVSHSSTLSQSPEELHKPQQHLSSYGSAETIDDGGTLLSAWSLPPRGGNEPTNAFRQRLQGSGGNGARLGFGLHDIAGDLGGASTWLDDLDELSGPSVPSRGGESGARAAGPQGGVLDMFSDDEEGGGGHPSAAAPGKDAEATPAASSSSSYAYFPRPPPPAGAEDGGGALYTTDYAACGGGPSAEDEGALGSAHRRGGGGAAPGGDRHAGRDAGFLLSGYEGFSSSGGGGELWGAAHEHHASGGGRWAKSAAFAAAAAPPAAEAAWSSSHSAAVVGDFGIPPSQRSPDSSRTGVGAVGGAAPTSVLTSPVAVPAAPLIAAASAPVPALQASSPEQPLVLLPGCRGGAPAAEEPPSEDLHAGDKRRRPPLALLGGELT